MDTTEALEITLNKLNDIIERQAEQIKELESENKKLRELKCPPIESGDTCICPIEELEAQLDNARDILWGEKANYVKGLEDGLISIRKSTEIMEARRFAEEALKQ